MPRNWRRDRDRTFIIYPVRTFLHHYSYCTVEHLKPCSPRIRSAALDGSTTIGVWNPAIAFAVIVAVAAVRPSCAQSIETVALVVCPPPRPGDHEPPPHYTCCGCSDESSEYCCTWNAESRHHPDYAAHDPTMYLSCSAQHNQLQSIINSSDH